MKEVGYMINTISTQMESEYEHVSVDVQPLPLDWLPEGRFITVVARWTLTGRKERAIGRHGQHGTGQGYWTGAEAYAQSHPDETN